MFNEQEKLQIERHGLTVKQVEKQIENFRNGFDFLSINRAAVVGDGILGLEEKHIEQLIAAYEKQAPETKIVKFVPASGAATRMFKDLYEYVNEDKKNPSVDVTLSDLEKFAFHDELKEIVGAESDPKKIISAIIKDGLNYGSQPKALILFHKYIDACRSAAEEHLVEGVMYGQSNGISSIHFTVSPEHKKGFDQLFKNVCARNEKKYKVKYDLSLSFQKSSTDTIAVTPGNKPFVNDDGTLLFRPAGHGALIENLNDIEADIVFIKTIDNVAPDSLKADTIRYKKALAGLLLEIQKDTYSLLRTLDFEKENPKVVEDIGKFVEQRLLYKLSEKFEQKTTSDKFRILKQILNRPIRVCGMVKNEGEPGGGPFWVNGPDQSESLQIAESSQISPEQMGLMKNATHFNPVDLVCAVRDYRGKKFDLRQYVDPATGFISSKSKDGRELRAQELPGLWNGAMANWNTIFVEVPISTFSPVKVVNDLLRPQHQ